MSTTPFASTPTAPGIRPPLRLSRLAMALVAGLIACNGLAVMGLIHRERNDALATQLRENVNLTSVLQEQTARVLASADQVTLRLADAVREHPGTPPDLPRLATETGLPARILVQLSLVGPNGRFIASNLDPSGQKTGPVDLSEREHIQAHLPGTGTKSTDLFIGKPVLGKVSKRWTLQLSRAIHGTDGQLLGIAVASLDPAYFEDVFASVALGQQGSVSLVGDDLRVRAQVVGQQAKGMGTALSPQSLLATLPSHRSGQRIGPDSDDGVERVQAFQRVGDYPLAVQVTSAASEALDDWRSARNLILALAGLAAVAVVGVSVPFVRRLQRLEHDQTALARQHAESQAQMQSQHAWLMTLVQRLRTPVTNLLGTAAWLGRSLPEGGPRQQAHPLLQEAEQLSAMLDELGDLARLNANAMPLHLESLALHTLVHAVTEPQRAAAAAKGLDLRIHIDPDVPERLHCDGLRVRQVLSRLLANAIRYTEQGEVAIEVDSVPGWLRLHVADTGVGIPGERQVELVPRTPPGAPSKRSSGLSLSLAQALAEHMAGQLRLESVPGMGSRFTLCLPLKD